MSRNNLIGRFQGNTPAVRARDSRTGIPDDVLREASRRLGVVSLVAGALWIIGTAAGHVIMRLSGHPGWNAIAGSDVIAVVMVLASVALYIYSRRTDRAPRFILDLGLYYMIFNGMGLGFNMHSDPLPPGFHPFPLISWNGVAVLIFASIVPSSPGKTLVAGLVTVSMNPLGMLAATLRGNYDLPMSTAILVHYPDYLLVGVSVVISLVITRLGQQVTRAREMGSYQIGELLGAGGMGEVYRATHRMLARPAAIKLIRPEMLGAGDSESAQVAIARFKREAEVAASLRSPHTIELYDFGVTEDQTLYFVMELLEGMDLETMVRDTGPLPADRVIFILCQVCDSLEEAHSRGLVHRDVKPANIHVGRRGIRYDFVKVLDFGLVKSFTGDGGGATLATGVGLTPGTPAYMAPEMARGDAVDGRADIYALGCVAFYLLTGHLVFDGSNPMDILLKHAMHLPPRPSSRGANLVPQALEEVILSCLAKEPEDRPETAGELARRLSSIGLKPWTQVEARRWWEEKPAVVTG